MTIEPGMLAKSKAGRDKECVYVVVSVEGEYICLADGKKRTVAHVKRKNPKHIQVIKVRTDRTFTDENIRDTIRTYLDRQKQEL